jgi:NitT/TauT family transport system ATP-binding protein
VAIEAADRRHGGILRDEVPPLRAERLHKVFGVDEENPAEVVADVTLELRAGEIIAVVGPSGCGKTTLLNLLCGLLKPTSGSVYWHGRRSVGMPESVGYMLQKDLLLPWRTALANITVGLEIRGVPPAERRDRAHKLLDQLGLRGFADHYPATLSGGMRQRVALARTLAHEPQVLLLDEPFASLDFQTKLLIESDTAKLVRGGARAMMMITHDVEEAVSLSDRVIVLSHRPTRIRSSYIIQIDGDRTDMIEARTDPRFQGYVRSIWSDLEVRTE